MIVEILSVIKVYKLRLFGAIGRCNGVEIESAVN
jgi:hypothetical protein